MDCPWQTGCIASPAVIIMLFERDQKDAQLIHEILQLELYSFVLSQQGNWLSFHKITPRRSNLYFKLSKLFKFSPEGKFEERGKDCLQNSRLCLAEGRGKRTPQKGGWRGLRITLATRPSLNPEKYPRGTTGASQDTSLQRIHAHVALGETYSPPNAFSTKQKE